jgi:hypothetical protein
MDERDFLDMMYQGWSKTTEAEHSFWMHEPMANNQSRHKVYAVKVDPETQEQTRTLVASFLSEEDAAFITAIHGSLPDIVRRCNEAYDEADRLDLDRDEQECRIAELEMENGTLVKELDKLLDQR